ncbi:hypothetical protein F3J37_01665 [Pantoea sp. Al-1710]|uniref:Uncharacterized protein n=1 Tax=Candidatus Pantoea communis TaxID=2608354 RepID=A0ABX0RIE5_9GAMM|nr:MULTISPECIES: M91 family zinc metallopeptidase [Pantoea]NIG12913.1 hypothetical protein [Pantoea sp. Cy-640]NIG17386.1 hypothetical protein [Pantoea communis]
MDLIRRQSSVVPSIEIVSEYEEDTNKTEAALTKIKSKPVGRQLLKEISDLSKNGRSISVNVSETFRSQSIPILTKSQLKKYGIEESYSTESNIKAQQISAKKGFMRKGEGVSSIVDFDPSYFVKVTLSGHHQSEINEELAFTTLAHELIHSYRFLKGTSFNTSGGVESLETKREERRVIGTGEFANAKISENAIRREHGLTERTKHQTELSYEQERQIQDAYENSSRQRTI